MIEDITSLQIKVDYADIEKAEKALYIYVDASDKAEKSTQKVERASASLTSQLLKMVAAYVSFNTVANQFRQIISTTREWQVLRASIDTVTGSTENGAEAWEALMDLAWELPFGVEKVSQAFIQLVNFGLTPSERAIRSYANTASAMSRDVTDFANAVASATTGNFQSLRSFGIQASKDGDKVRIAFKGVTTEVANTTAALEEYFIKLGETHYGDATERRLKLLDDAFAGVEESWKRFQYALGDSYFSDVAIKGLRGVTDMIFELTEAVKSGEMSEGFKAWGVGLAGWQRDFKMAFHEFTNDSRKTYNGFFDDTESLWEDVKAVMQGVPVAFRALVQTSATIFYGIVSAIQEIGRAMYRVFKKDIDALIELAKVGFSAVTMAAKGQFSSAWDELKTGSMRAMEDRLNTEKEITTTFFTNLRNHWGASVWSFNRMVEEAGTSYGMQQVHRRRAKMLADLWAQRPEKQGDRLKQYGVDRKEDQEEGGADKSLKKAIEKEAREWEALQKTLLENQERTINESYQHRLSLIKKYTEEGSNYQTTLELSLTDKFEEEQRRRIESLKSTQSDMYALFRQEEDLIKAAYEKRKEIILSATEATESERVRMLKEAEEQYNIAQAGIDQKRQEHLHRQLDITRSFFDDLAAATSAYGKKGAAIAKAAAVAGATISMIQSAQNAYLRATELPYGMYLAPVFAATALAAGAANIAKIKATNYAGEYATGGLIPPGKVGLVGEAGPEFVRGPALVTSAQATWDRGGGASADGGASKVEINIINNTDSQITENRRRDGDKELVELIINQVQQKVSSDISKGGTKVAKAIEQTYNLTRGRR